MTTLGGAARIWVVGLGLALSTIGVMNAPGYAEPSAEQVKQESGLRFSEDDGRRGGTESASAVTPAGGRAGGGEGYAGIAARIKKRHPDLPRPDAVLQKDWERPGLLKRALNAGSMTLFGTTEVDSGNLTPFVIAAGLGLAAAGLFAMTSPFGVVGTIALSLFCGAGIFTSIYAFTEQPSNAEVRRWHHNGPQDW